MRKTPIALEPQNDDLTDDQNKETQRVLSELKEAAEKFQMTTADYRRQARDYILGSIEPLSESERKELESYLDRYYGPIAES